MSENSACNYDNVEDLSEACGLKNPPFFVPQSVDITSLGKKVINNEFFVCQGFFFVL